MNTTITNIPTVVKKYSSHEDGKKEEIHIFLDAEIRPNINGNPKLIDIHFNIPDRFKGAFKSLHFHLQDYNCAWYQTSCDNWPVTYLGELDTRLGQTTLYVNYF